MIAVSNLRVDGAGAYVPSALDWAYAEDALGVELPREYSSFVERYGSGSSFGCVTVYVPMRPRPSMQWREELVGSAETAREEVLVRRAIVGPGADAPAAFIPFARSDYGHIFYWPRVGSHVDAAIHAGPSRMNREHRVCDSFFAFTEGLIAGTFERTLGIVACAPVIVSSPFHG